MHPTFLKLTNSQGGLPVWINWNNIAVFTPTSAGGALVVLTEPLPIIGQQLYVTQDCETIERAIFELSDNVRRMRQVA
jgi:hypothetical protein